MLAAVRKLLELPSCTFDRGFDGLRETTRLAWVRPADIWFRNRADFHTTSPLRALRSWRRI
jgi:hypothetical protein